MKKNLTSKILNLWKKPLIKIICYLLILIMIFVISRVLNNKNEETNILEYIKIILTQSETISFFAAGIFTIIVATIISSTEKRLEESLKIESDHHKIIAQYKNHKKDKISVENNYYNNDGIFMELHHTKKYKKPIKNFEKDIYSSKYQSLQKELELYNDKGVLILPSINIFTNILGNTNISLEDSNEVKQLPDFIIGNGTEFIKAHKYSQLSNNLTIRLDDISFENNILKLYTSRSYYYHMLLTNRCMDYQLANGMSVRKIYEFGSKISPLNESKLSNQIGINGMIITNDGYLLLEKRDRKKTTWKNKFAQPISLALKSTDLKITSNTIMDSDVEYANKKLIEVIKKTMDSNFGITEEDYDELSLEKNFLGIARDLLEGGKPNLYFVVTLKYSYKELMNKLKNNAGRNDPDIALQTGKLSSKYYLVNYSDIHIDFGYSLKLKQKNVYKVKRIVYPRCSKSKEKWDDFKYFLSKTFRKNIEYECGEALLVTLSYLELCQKRIIELKDK